MRLNSIRLNNFRNHRSTYLNFSDNINIFYGNNGQGKTNILDSISYLCLTKGFISSDDKNSVLFNENEFEIEGRFCSDLKVSSKSGVFFSSNGRGKNISQNDVKIDRAISYIGEYPIVLLAPQNYGIVSGMPAERRKFVDVVISQSSKSYMNDIMEYRKVLKHRNKILLDSKLHRRFELDEIEPWNESLVKYGSRVIEKRDAFIREFIPYFLRSYKEITEANEIPSIKYMPRIGQFSNGLTFEEIKVKFSHELIDCFGDEVRRGTTLLGPHKDEFGFEINDLDVREFASQGQQKTFLISLKIAEYFYLKEKCAETPMLVLDDVFSELDKIRSKYLLSFLENIGQVFISSTVIDVFNEALSFETMNSKFYVENGCVRE
jgi:DNA replication and repair protein RecF